MSRAVIPQLFTLYGGSIGATQQDGAKAAFDLAEARQLIVKYRNQWIADPDKIRDARIGAIYDIPLIGTAVCGLYDPVTRSLRIE